MQWWNEFVDWLNSDEGWRILSSVVFPLLAILAAGLIAALIGRGSTRRLLAHHDREQRVSTVAALIGAARRASKWNTLSVPEQQHAEHLAHAADVSTRLLPLAGASMTADWAAHEIAEMKKNSVSFSFQAEQSLMDFRDRLVEWQSRPSRAKKLFKADLDLWAYESAQEDKGLVEKQQEWAKQQVATETGPTTAETPASKPLSWGTQSDATTATSETTTAPPAATPSLPAPAAAPAAATPSTAGGAAPAAATYTAPPVVAPTMATPAPAVASSGSPATPPSGTRPATSAPTAGTGEHPTVEAPSPVSAQTVRQRVLPDSYSDDDLR